MGAVIQFSVSDPPPRASRVAWSAMAFSSPGDSPSKSDEIMGEQEVRRFVLALQESGEDYIPLQKLLFGPQTRNELSHFTTR